MLAIHRRETLDTVHVPLLGLRAVHVLDAVDRVVAVECGELVDPVAHKDTQKKL